MHGNGLLCRLCRKFFLQIRQPGLVPPPVGDSPQPHHDIRIILLPFQIPGFGLIVALIGLTLVGFLTANLVGRTLVRVGEDLLNRMPVVRGIYKALKQVFSTVFSQLRS